MGDQLQLLDNLSEDELITFLCSNKNMISSIEEPIMFIRELQDNGLIPEEQNNEINKKLGKGEGREGIYDFLSWFEKNNKQHVRTFWRRMFCKHICMEYPSILSLRKELLKAGNTDGIKPGPSNTFPQRQAEPAKQPQLSKTPNIQINEKKTMERGTETNPNRAENTDGINPGSSNTFPRQQAEPAKQPQLSQTQNIHIHINTTMENVGEKKLYTAKQPQPSNSSVAKIIPTEKNETMKMTEENKGKDNMAPGSSSSFTEKKTTPAKSSELSGNELLVTCDEKVGILHRDKLLKGIKCIKNNIPRGRWYLPSEFEIYAGRKNSKNWKNSIFHEGIPLQKLINDGLLQCAPKMKRRSHKRRKVKKKPRSAGPTV